MLLAKKLGIGALAAGVLIAGWFYFGKNFTVEKQASEAAGGTHYVRASGSGNQSGADWNNACNGFSGSCAVGSLVRGDTYYVAGGSYGTGSWNRSESGTIVITIKRATGSDHGTDTGWSSSYDGQVNWTARWTFSTGYWNFDGVTGRSVPLPQAVPYGFRLADSSAGGQGLVEINSGNNITIGYTDLDGVQCCAADYSNGPYGIHSNGLGANFRFHHSAVHNTKSDPIHLNSPGSGVIIEHSYIARNEGLLSDNHGQGIWMQGWQSAQIRYNFFEDVVGTGHIVCGSGSGTIYCDNISIYGNVFYHTRTHPQSSSGNVSGDESTYLVECISPDNSCHGMVFYNNTIVGFDDYNAGFYGGETNVIIRNNIWYNISTGIALGGTADNNSTLSGTSPFASISNRDFHLPAASQAGATLSSTYNLDPDGKTRGSDGTWDRGAYEFGPGGSPSPTTGSSDLNSDGKVDVVDLGILLSSWGQTTKPKADINQDSKVDVVDLGILLGKWGTSG